jgi:pyrroline-5-carboxylate reductase
MAAMVLKTTSIGSIGGGAMAEALLGGLLASGLSPDQLFATDPDPDRRRHLTESLGIATGDDNDEAVRRSDVVLLAVKPGVIHAVLDGLTCPEAERLRPLWVSIAAGVTLEGLGSGLPKGAHIVRAMPNTPALIRTGATGICGNDAASDHDLQVARALFDCVGLTWESPREDLLDAVTGLSGSGPAYVFAFLEALMDAGEAAGLPREAAEQLTLQTVYGAAKLALESDKTPAELRRQVSSPGGTTLAGLARLGDEGFAEAIHAAVRAATDRAEELGKGS